MAEKQNTPEIRFEGFTDPWEQRKLGELMGVTSVRRVRQEDWTDEGVRFLRARDLVAFAKNEAIEDPLFISDEMYREYSAQSGKAVVGDLLVTGVGTIGVPWLVTSENPVYFKDGNIIWFKNQNAIDGEFFYHSFTAHAIQSFIKEAAGIGTVGTYTIETGKKTPIWLPLEQEQRQIAAFMTSLDTLITLHQRKYDKLCTVKKSMLDKMFPKPGETEPEIRFAGFTDPWEQRKLGRLFFESNERSSSMEILSVSVAKGIYPASESDRDTNPGASLANYKVVHKGDIVYNSMRMWQGAVGSSDYDGIVSPAYVVARPAIELDTTCFGYLLKRPEMLYKYLCDSQGNSKDTQTLKFNRFADIEVTMPANLEEQRVISACLGRVDTLITLHQRKLDLLKNTKKALLDKMFV